MLVGLTAGVCGQSWSGSRQQCVRAIDSHCWELYLVGRLNSPSPASSYLEFTHLQSKAYDRFEYVISDKPCNVLIHLIQTNPTLATFSLLIMYSIRHRTLIDHPDSFPNLFQKLFEFEKFSHSVGKLTIPSPVVVQLIKTRRGPISTEPTHSNTIPHPFHLEPTSR